MRPLGGLEVGLSGERLVMRLPLMSLGVTQMESLEKFKYGKEIGENVWLRGT